MKKFWIIFFIFIIVLGAILIFALVSFNQKFIAKSYVSEGEISAIIVNVADREVEVSQSADDKIHIDFYESEKEYYNISVSENNELVLSLEQNKSFIDYFGTKPSKTYRKIYLQVPKGILQNIEITTTNERIALNNVSVNGNISLISNGGNIDFNSLSAGKEVKLSAKNGNINGSIVGKWDDFTISCTVKKGECNLPSYKDGGDKTLTAECNNGNINIEFENIMTS